MSLERLVDDANAAIAAALAAGARACVTSSFQHDCVALVHLVTRQLPGIPVLFLETGITLTRRLNIAIGCRAPGI